MVIVDLLFSVLTVLFIGFPVAKDGSAVVALELKSKFAQSVFEDFVSLQEFFGDVHFVTDDARHFFQLPVPDDFCVRGDDPQDVRLPGSIRQDVFFVSLGIAVLFKDTSPFFGDARSAGRCRR